MPRAGLDRYASDPSKETVYDGSRPAEIAIPSAIGFGDPSKAIVRGLNVCAMANPSEVAEITRRAPSVEQTIEGRISY